MSAHRKPLNVISKDGNWLTSYPGDRRVFVHSESGAFLGFYVDANWVPIMSRDASDEMLRAVLARKPGGH